ncbi:hypothetical protein [Streptomyces sp. NPDC091649]|uniref:hypothetical protein n=1 Tax=Streptomyces sp. NPDC091649 TaxID=3366004 RepID=UPI00382EAC53
MFTELERIFLTALLPSGPSGAEPASSFNAFWTVLIRAGSAALLSTSMLSSLRAVFAVASMSCLAAPMAPWGICGEVSADARQLDRDA